MARLFSHVPRIEARAALVSVVVAVLLTSLKFLAYFLTGSAAIFSDALESVVNVVASAVAFYSLFVAHKPADIDHPYGHGKIEFLSASFEGGMILLAAIVILVRTAEAIIRGQVVIEELNMGLVLVAIAMLVNGAVGGYLVRIGRRQNSMTLEADGYHLLSDAVTSVTVLIALVIIKLLHTVPHIKYVDPAAALLIAGYVALTGVRLLMRSTASLMDRQDMRDLELLQKILDGHLGPAGEEPRICSYHKLRHRRSGRYHWVEFHMMVPATLTVQQGHAIASAIEYEIEQALGESNATAHVEPCQDERCVLRDAL